MTSLPRVLGMAAVLTVASLTGGLRADTLISRNGDVLQGTVLKESEEEILFRSDLVGEVRLARSSVLRIDYAPEEVASGQAEEPAAREETSAEVVIGPAGRDYWDWIQLDSGEWLKGTIKAMYRNELEFDSDELDTLTFDWEDIARIRSGRVYSVRIDEETTRTGLLEMEDGTLSIADGQGQEVGQYEIIAIAPGGDDPTANWSARLSFSAGFRSGAVEEKDLSARGVLQYRTAKSRAYFDFLANYNESSTEVTANDYRATSYFDSFWKQNVFFRLVSVDYYRDPLQNISSRWTVSSAVGYTLFSNRKTDWDVTLGPAWQRTVFDEVGSGEDTAENELAVVFTSQLDTEITKRIDFSATFNYQLSGGRQGSMLHLLAVLEYELTDRIDFDTTLIWDYIGEPEPTSDGSRPDRNDVRLTFGIGFEL